ncbi:LPS-assembly protein LptD [Janthinobacterium sp. 17J80-10]|uniref:LPS-assembly protein LptD n=1 Tax=Janthinobacterium sp. 17J80-10 TaxID=2497863 RepID=UPI00100580C0|nr:LPS-assembly protein LptD [Janthinobacterium sp. 17J80-10]QAU35644.1 LPS-assembly protein LptD [Janthinobacterium sp. 17J80-10]
MIRFPAFSDSPVIFCVVTTTVAAALPGVAAAQVSERDLPVNISAERMTGRPDREVQFDTNVEIIQGTTTILGDHATYNILKDEVDASGNIRMERMGDHYTGESVRLRIDSGEGFVTQPTYKLQKNNAHGTAERIDFQSEDEAVVSNGTYSTCESPDPDWYLKSSSLRLDRERDTGFASGTVVYFKGVPILGTPAMSFPLSDERKSGVLPPSIGSTNKGGLVVTVPYYFNIAPNRDLTLYPKIISRRGVQLGAEGRYLGETYKGDTRVEYMPGDRQTKTDRYALSSIHTQTFAPAWTYNWNLNAASDDQYPDDFASTITTSKQRLLNRAMSLAYNGPFWTATLAASNFQVLQDPLVPISRPYDRLPQFVFSAAKQDVNGFDWSAVFDATRFAHPTAVVGNRAVVIPKLSYPIIRPGFFITPSVSLHASSYAIDNPLPGTPRSLNRAVPTASLDSGLIFEREASFLGKPVTQTLEPRLFYVYTPYRDQSLFPLFDTGLADFNYGQLFSENRFIGSDRVSDANQLTAALVSRFIEPSGAERARLAIGQRYYLADQKVTLPGVLNSQTRSDLLLTGSGRVSKEISVDANMQYSQSLRTMVRDNYGVRWQPGPMRVLNLQYRRDVSNLLSPLEQLDVSAQWPLTQRWYGVGRINYSLRNDQPAVVNVNNSLRNGKVAEALLGLEYKADCWIFRVVAQRTPTASNAATTGFFIQLELNGLSRIGSNPLDALRQNIQGYQMINQPTNTSR